MLNTSKIEDSIAIILLLGIIFSAALVLSGGLLYIIEQGMRPIDFTALQHATYKINVIHFFATFHFSALALIELGLLTLVIAQILRVALLVIAYALMKDYRFTYISLFVLIIMLYSFVWQV